MDISPAQLHSYKTPNKVLDEYSDINEKKDTLTPQVDITENRKTKVSLSSEALTQLDIDKTENNKTNEQKEIAYGVAKQKYQEKVNELPIDYRKMKMIKDKINEEIKMLKAEISTIKQSLALNKKEMEQQISELEQQISVKSLAVLEINKEFIQKLKADERSKLLSPESAAEMMKTLNASPPEAPADN